MVEYLHEAKASRPYPHVLTLGNNNHHPSQAFVIIAGQALEQDALLQAIDVCFKAFFILDIKYPKECEHVWEFLQSVIYEIPGGESKLVRFLQSRILACPQGQLVSARQTGAWKNGHCCQLFWHWYELWTVLVWLFSFPSFLTIWLKRSSWDIYGQHAITNICNVPVLEHFILLFCNKFFRRFQYCLSVYSIMYALHDQI